MNTEQITTQFSPRIDLPYRYLITGLVFLFVGVIYLFLKPASLTGYYIRSQEVLFLVHTFGIGFVTSIMMGAMYQLLSVILQAPLFSERLGKLNYWIYITGLAGMLVSFFYEFKMINIAGAVLALALLLFVFNAGLTIISARKMDIIIAHVVMGVVSLLIVLLLGALMSENILRDFFNDPLILIRIHLSFALFGWIIITTMGFSYKLIPMFMLSHGYREHYSRLSLYTLVPGLVIYSASEIFPQIGISGKVAFLLIIAGTIFYLAQMYLIFKARLRRRIEPQLMATVLAKFFLLSGIILAPLVYYYSESFSSHYAPVILLLFGFVGLYILGMMHKIVPFLEWYNKYSPKIGKEKVPLTKDMINESLINPALYLWTGGTIAIALGSWFSEVLVVRFGALAMLFSTVLFLWNILNVFRK
jgi:hypothetical protein